MFSYGRLSTSSQYKNDVDLEIVLLVMIWVNFLLWEMMGVLEGVYGGIVGWGAG